MKNTNTIFKKMSQPQIFHPTNFKKGKIINSLYSQFKLCIWNKDTKTNTIPFQNKTTQEFLSLRI